MGLESFGYIDSLNTANPTSSDPKSEGDDHLRGIKLTLTSTFPNLTGAVTATHTEINYVDGVTSDIQTQIDTKQSATADYDVGDNVKIKLGDSDDLQIYHDGSNSLINETGAGLLKLRGSAGVVFEKHDGTETLLTAYHDDAVSLYHDNSVKLATTSTGIDVTGSVTCDGLAVSDSTSAGYETTVFENTASNGYVQHYFNVGAGGANGQAAIGYAPGIFMAFGPTANDTTTPIVFRNNNATERMRIDTSGNVGIGTSSPTQKLEVSNGISLLGNIDSPPNPYSGGLIDWYSGTTRFFSYGANTTTKGAYSFDINESDAGSGGGGAYLTAMTIDNSGNVLVGRTSVGSTGNGHSIRGGDSAVFSRIANGLSSESMIVNKDDYDGVVIQIRKNGSIVGGIGTGNSGDLYIGNSDTGLMFAGGSDAILPTNDSSLRDNAIDVGHSSFRFDDIYATNGTIQTSDRNEKQDIEELSEAEQRVAIACKGLLRKFRWIDAVEKKGDDARIHFGIIAQDLQDAFTAEGLDAGRYAMFISSTWYEKQTPVDAVEAVEAVYETVVTTPAAEAQEAVMGERQVMETIETGTYVNLAGETITETSEVGVTEAATETVVEIQTDEEGNRREVEVERTVQVPVMEAYETSPATEAVAEETEERLVSEAVEAKDAYTRTETEEEPTAGYTERTRLGVRYPELLAFIISAI